MPVLTVLGEIAAVPLIIAFFWWWTFGGGGSTARYWQCSARHYHQTPEAARKCSLAQLRH